MIEVLANVSCIAIEGRGVLIAGKPGSGKSSLALALIDRGAQLIGDDGVTLQAETDRVNASPPPEIAGLIEIRNVGLVRMATTSAPLALSLRLTDEAPRLPEGPDALTLCGLTIPQIALHPHSPVLALRAEWALKQFGLA